jgi:hypothetical protein
VLWCVYTGMRLGGKDDAHFTKRVGNRASSIDNSASREHGPCDPGTPARRLRQSDSTIHSSNPVAAKFILFDLALHIRHF